MFAASQYLRRSANTSTTVFGVFEAVIVVVGLILTFNAYRRGTT
jgi:hypothetical protein